jgi:hypothetical protein
MTGVGMGNLIESISVLLVATVLVFGVLAAIFLVGRELVCWYAKINERLELEKKRSLQLDDIAKSLRVLIEIEVAKKKERDEANSFGFTDVIDPKKT